MLHQPMTPEQLLAISRRLKMPLKHVTEYARFLRGHPTTKLAADTKRFINEKLSLERFTKLDNAVGLERTSKRTDNQ